MILAKLFNHVDLNWNLSSRGRLKLKKVDERSPGGPSAARQ